MLLPRFPISVNFERILFYQLFPVLVSNFNPDRQRFRVRKLGFWIKGGCDYDPNVLDLRRRYGSYTVLVILHFLYDLEEGSQRENGNEETSNDQPTTYGPWVKFRHDRFYTHHIIFTSVQQTKCP